MAVTVVNRNDHHHHHHSRSLLSSLSSTIDADYDYDTPSTEKVMLLEVNDTSTCSINKEKQWRQQQEQKQEPILRRCYNIVENIPLDLLFTVIVWYLIGVASICTTKILISTKQVPPLVVTVQQLAISSIILRLYLSYKKEVQPLPQPIITSNTDDDDDDDDDDGNSQSTTKVSSLTYLHSL